MIIEFSLDKTCDKIHFQNWEALPFNRKLYVTLKFESRHEISNNMVCATSNGSDQPAHRRSLIRAFASRLNMAVKLRGVPKLNTRLHWPV